MKCEDQTCPSKATTTIYGVHCCGDHLQIAAKGLVFLRASKMRGFIDHSKLFSGKSRAR